MLNMTEGSRAIARRGSDDDDQGGDDGPAEHRQAKPNRERASGREGFARLPKDPALHQLLLRHVQLLDHSGRLPISRSLDAVG